MKDFLKFIHLLLSFVGGFFLAVFLVYIRQFLDLPLPEPGELMHVWFIFIWPLFSIGSYFLLKLIPCFRGKLE